jgi:TonB family protein
MLYCTAVSALLGLGAVALERALGALGRPTRGAWAGAILLSAALPFALPSLMELRTRLAAPAAGAAGGLGALQAAEAGPIVDGPTTLQAADLLLLPAWLLASAGLLLAGCALALTLHLRRRGWRPAMVAGVPVLVSEATGPAVVGFVRGSIVLPEWALEWDGERQRMMVEHEREHLRARDPLLLLLGLAAAAAVPWNAALWWQLRRLRLAMEVDCDARVLRRRVDVRAYGLLLLDVGRLASSSRVPTLALTEPPSFLERRIRVMTNRTLDRRFRRAALPAAVCAGALVLAAALPGPGSGVPGWDVLLEVGQPIAADTVPLPAGVIDVGDATDKPRLLNGAQVQRLMVSSYPPALRGAAVTGSARVALVVDARGAVAEARSIEATRVEFADAAVAVMRQARFTPATRAGQPVAVRVVVPVTFDFAPPQAGLSTPVPPSPASAPAEPSRQRRNILDVGALDRQPTLRNALQVQRLLQAGYPPLLRDAGVTGEVQVAFVVTEEGETRDVRVVSASNEAFGEPAVAAVRAMRFTPGELAGKATAARVQIPVSFTPVRTEPAAPTQET